ncbi:MAG: bifunctional ADP-dependent NAD(P)H-hydrate dehydratase/NAD(P)H-hydrate epimerase, partial [Clostridiales bacterium]|nr:bifunctional ADP-dependent NAD(P)H-hydrate dehydratase/NAD(P)H-hydrate epimerase [Clostridiales bacterium]
DVMVDAIYGIGLKGSLREPSRSVLARIRSMNYPHVVAVDIPSGIDSDTGANTGAVIPAEVTITFGRNKTGLVTGEGVKAAGRVIVCDIGIPDEAYDKI